MEPSTPGFAGGVLCGGASRRMGEPKALIKLNGVTLLERASERLRLAGAAPLLLASARGELRAPGCLSLADAAAGQGPLGGLVSLLRAMPGHLCAVVAVDMPDLSPELLRVLACQWDGEDAMVPLSTRGPEPLHAVYAASALAQAELALGSEDMSLRGLLSRLRVRSVEVAPLLGTAVAATFAANLNRPEELTAWRRRRRQEAGRQPPD